MSCIATFVYTQNGLYSAIPYTCLAVMALVVGQVTDVLRQRKYVSTTVVRKINTTLGAYLYVARQ